MAASLSWLAAPLALSLVVKMQPIPILLVLTLFLGGCATQRDRDPVLADQPTPAQLAAQPRSQPLGAALTWGGVVVAVRNLADRTVLEVLAYPLRRDHSPDTDSEPQGRFLVDHDGFLEPRDYPAGRALTVSGSLLGYRDGSVAGGDYRFPAISADEKQRWEVANDRKGPGWRAPRVGVGVSVGSGGRSGVGINIGF